MKTAPSTQTSSFTSPRIFTSQHSHGLTSRMAICWIT